MQVTSSKNNKDKDIDDLWRQYKEENSDEARERLIIQYAPLVRVFAGQIGTSSTSVEERESWGILGLIEAIDRYKPDYGCKFEHYAKGRIKGAIIDGMRKEGHISPSLIKKAKVIEEAMGELGNKLGRLPDDEELAAHLGIGMDELMTTMDRISRGLPLSLDMPVSSEQEDGLCLMDIVPDNTGNSVEEEVSYNELKDVLSEAIDRLKEKEKIIITLYYYEGFTLKEIGQVLDLSESRVSQMHTKAVFKMRMNLPRKKFVANP